MLRTGSLLVFTIGIALSSCQKPEEYPIIPSLEFKSIYTDKDTGGYDQDVVIVTGFTDGDGDIGYYSVESGQNDPIFDDPHSEYYNNYKVTKFQRKNGVWVKDSLAADGSVLNLDGRLYYMTPSGSNKALKGEIKRTVSVDVGLNRDTFRYDVFIYDRGLHKSNVITTDPIVLTTR